MSGGYRCPEALRKKTVSDNTWSRNLELDSPGLGAGMAVTFATKAANARTIGMVGMCLNGCIVEL